MMPETRPRLASSQKHVRRHTYWYLIVGIAFSFPAFLMMILSFDPGDEYLLSSRIEGLDLNSDPQTSSEKSKSLGQQIVEASYRTSGFKDFTTDFCPKENGKESLPSRFSTDYVTNCLVKAKEAGNNPGTKYHDRWEWWFRTLLRDLVGKNIANRNHLTGRWHILQFKEVGSPAANGNGKGAAAAAPRLQMCVYEKGGTKSWKKLQCEHNRDYYRDVIGVPEKPNFNHCWMEQPPYDEVLSHKTNTTTTAYKSERVVFVRDPLDRFLSGFLDKCVARGDKGDHCEPVSVFAEGKHKEQSTTTTQRSPIETMLWDKRRTFQAFVDTFPLTWNMHFFPQSFNCGGLYKTIGDYDFVGSMGTNFYRDLETMQKRYPGLEPGFEEIFKLSTRLRSESGNVNKGVETGAAKKVLEFYTPHTVRRVLEYYAIDYIALGLPIPEWAEEMLLRSK